MKSLLAGLLILAGLFIFLGSPQAAAFTQDDFDCAKAGGSGGTCFYRECDGGSTDAAVPENNITGSVPNINATILGNLINPAAPIVNDALKAQAATKVPAAVLLAQGAMESGDAGWWDKSRVDDTKAQKYSYFNNGGGQSLNQEFKSYDTNPLGHGPMQLDNWTGTYSGNFNQSRFKKFAQYARDQFGANSSFTANKAEHVGNVAMMFDTSILFAAVIDMELLPSGVSPDTATPNQWVNALTTYGTLAGVTSDKISAWKTLYQTVKTQLGNAAASNNPEPRQATTCCPDSGSDGPATQLVGNSPGEQVYNYFASKGLSKESVAAVTGNLQVESSFRADIWGGGGGNYYGLAQWSRNDRYVKLVQFAGSTERASKLNYQLDFVWHELNTGYKSTLQNLQGHSSMRDKAVFFGRHYEVAVNADGSLQAEATRIAYATQWFNKDKGAGPVIATPTDAPNSDSVDCSGTSSPITSADGYSNPFHDTKNLVQSRIDEGVDYAAKAGTKVPLYAIGKAVVTKSTDKSTFYTTSHGYATWITYQLKTNGPGHDKYVYVSEACSPIYVHEGQQIDSSTHLCDILPDSIEMGWALDATSQAAAAVHVYKEGYETAYGVNFNQLLLMLGAPGGHLDTGSDPSGTVLGSLPAGWPKWSRGNNN